MRLTLATAPAFQILDLEETKAALRIEDPDDDVFITSLIEVAAEHIEGREGITRKQFRQAGYIARLPVLACQVELPLPPLVSVSSLSTVDEDGEETLLAASEYDVHADSYVGRVVSEWADDVREVIVSYTCGYPDAASIPAPVRHAARLLVGHWELHREAVVERQAYAIPIGVHDLLKPFSVPYNRRGNAL